MPKTQEEILAYRKEYYLKNKEKMLERAKAYQKSHRPVFIPLTEEEKKQRRYEQHKRYVEKNKEKWIEYSRDYYHKNKNIVVKRKERIVTKTPITKHYLVNLDFLYELKLCQGKGIRSRKLENFFYLICKNLSTKFYNNIDFRQDQVHSGFIRCCEVWQLYTEEKGKPFPYFSEVVKRSFIRERQIQLDLGLNNNKRDFNYVNIDGLSF